MRPDPAGAPSVETPRWISRCAVGGLDLRKINSPTARYTRGAMHLCRSVRFGRCVHNASHVRKEEGRTLFAEQSLVGLVRSTNLAEWLVCAKLRVSRLEVTELKGLTGGRY